MGDIILDSWLKHLLRKVSDVVMIEFPKNLFCENCGKETEHIVHEDALEIEYICTECKKEEEIIKSFF